MKQLFLFCALFLLTGLIMPVYSQNFQSATITEDIYPSGNTDLPFDPGHATAYSYGNLVTGGGVLSDLYVYTWDPGSTVYTTGGIAIRQYAAGTPVNNLTTPSAQDFNPTGWPVDETQSSEAVLLSSGGNIYVLATYYRRTAQRFFADLYQWNGAALAQVGTPQDITVSGPAAFGWIHLDALSLDKFVITWEENGNIYTKAGVPTAGGINMGNTAMLDNAGIGIGPSRQPDVALIRAAGADKVHFVYTANGDQQLVVSTLDFNTILGAPPPAPNPALLLPAPEDLQNSPGRFDLPRIDAPDEYAADDWSYVTTDHRPGRDNVFTGVMAGGALSHFILNDGSLGNPAIANAVPGQQENNRAVVAYDNTGANIFYAWYYFSVSNPPSFFPPSDRAYIGLKMTNQGVLINTWPNNRYWVVQTTPQNTASMPAIALSTQNDASPELFMAFLQNNILGHQGYIGIKTAPWNTNTSFRPDPLRIGNQSKSISIYAYPNPYTKSFQIAADTKGGGLYTATLTDISGRECFRVHGSVIQINKQLTLISRPIPVGIYFLKIEDEQERARQVIKISKQ